MNGVRPREQTCERVVGSGPRRAAVVIRRVNVEVGGRQRLKRNDRGTHAYETCARRASITSATTAAQLLASSFTSKSQKRTIS